MSLEGFTKNLDRVNVPDVGRNEVPDIWTAGGEGALPVFNILAKVLNSLQDLSHLVLLPKLGLTVDPANCSVLLPVGPVLKTELFDTAYSTYSHHLAPLIRLRHMALYKSVLID